MHYRLDDSISVQYIGTPNWFENFYTQSDSLQNGLKGFSGTSDWMTSSLQWIWYWPVKTYPQDSLIFRFNFISDSIQTNKDGWIIDNIEIGWVDLGSSVEEFENELEATIFPNVTSNNFSYVVKTENLTHLTMSNLTGQVVYQKSNPKLSGNIDVSDLPSGNYFVKFTSNSGAVVKRLVVN